MLQLVKRFVSLRKAHLTVQKSLHLESMLEKSLLTLSPFQCAQFCCCCCIDASLERWRHSLSPDIRLHNIHASIYSPRPSYSIACCASERSGFVCVARKHFENLAKKLLLRLPYLISLFLSLDLAAFHFSSSYHVRMSMAKRD